MLPFFVYDIKYCKMETDYKNLNDVYEIRFLKMCHIST